MRRLRPTASLILAFLRAPVRPLRWILLFSALAAAQQTAVISGPPVFEIHPPPPSFSFPKGVTFVYQVEWRLWNAGIATISLQDAGANSERITAVADSAGFVSVLYPVHDRFQSVFDRRTGCSQSVNKHTEEGFHKRETLINFNYSRRKSILDETNLKNGQPKHQENDIPTCVTDVLSGIFYVAAQRLAPGDNYNFPVNDGGETVFVRSQVEGREQLKLNSATVPTIRVVYQAASGKLKSRGQIWVWYTDDERHQPVQMRSRLFWGTLTFKLLRTETK